MAGTEPQLDNPQSWLAFADDWSVLDKYFRHAARIPADRETFRERYGDFRDQAGVDTFLAALKSVNEIAAALGGPDSLKRRMALDPGVLTGSAPPGEVYAHLVWLANQTQNVAKTLEQTLANVQQTARSQSAASKATFARDALGGEGGAADSAASLIAQIQALRKKIAAYPGPLGSAVKTLNGTELANEANETLGRLEGAVERTRKQLAEDDRKSRSSLPWGKPKESEVESLRTQFAEQEAEMPRKRQFTSDLNDFFAEGNQVVRALMNVDSRLSMLADFFSDVASRQADMARNANDTQISDPAWVARAGDLSTRTDQLKAIQAAAQRFTENALVSAPENGRPISSGGFGGQR